MQQPERHRPWRRVFFLASVFATLLIVFGCSGSSSLAPPLYRIGRATYDWTDTNRKEKYGPHPGTPRKLVVSIWYPASPAAGAKPGPYLKAEQASLLSPLVGIPSTTLQSLPTRSYIDAPLLANGPAFPVLLMSHGNGVPPLLYSNTAEYLASRGYIVVGISHTYNALWTIFSDNSIALQDPATDPSLVSPTLSETSGYADYIANLTAAAAIDADISRDIPFVLDKLTEWNKMGGMFQGRLRLDQVGMFGHSFGGSHSFRMLREEPRIRAAADVDGSLFNKDFALGTNKPLLILSGGRGSSADDEAVRQALLATGMTPTQADEIIAWKNSDQIAFEKSPIAYYVKLTQAKHSNFTDSGLLAAYGIPADDQISTTASPESLLNTSNAYLVGFFDEHLRGLRSPILHQAPASPDVLFESHP